jgi:hypothetical protein
VFAERHDTVAEVAAMWNLSKDAIRRLFQHEPGVLVLGNRTKGRKTTVRDAEDSGIRRRKCA